MTKPELIALLAKKQENQARYNLLANSKPLPYLLEQVNHDLETNEALWAATRSNVAYDNALKQYNDEQNAEVVEGF